MPTISGGSGLQVTRPESVWMMADIIRRSVWSGPGLEDGGAVFTDESYQRPRRLGNGKESRMFRIF
jgi:hypothetical protein